MTPDRVAAADPALGDTAPGRFGRGFHDESSTAAGRWAPAESTIEFAAHDQPRYLSCWVLSEFKDGSQALTIDVGGRTSRLTLPSGWSPISVEVPAGTSQARVVATKILPASHHPSDPRELAVRIRTPTIHADQAWHRRIQRQHENAIRNSREMVEGRASLTSTPRSLGIDMYAVCNVKPPCVYCGWDDAKAAEGPFVDTPFTVDTLREWGPIFDHSTNLINCSIGEPFMMKNIDELLDAFAVGGKQLEMTTNGQILTDTNIRKLLGRPIELYISFDAATPGTYAVLRNRRFEALVANVRRLIQAKGGRGELPLVNVVFMPMKANLGELDAFIDLCADLGVDHLVLRPLNYADKVDLNWEREGYKFDYDRELLPFDDLVRASGRAAELCRRAGVPLSDQMDFGGSLVGRFTELFDQGRRSVTSSDVVRVPAEHAAPPAAEPAPVPAPEPRPSLGAEHTPECIEPWKSLYILRRGVFPCCYGGRPVAPMDQYASAWNSPILQDIRRDLARGTFHRYCLDSPACPIVRKSAAAHELPLSHRLRLGAQRTRDRLHRGWHSVKWAGQWAGIRVRRIVTEPGYVGHQVRRIWNRRRGA